MATPLEKLQEDHTKYYSDIPFDTFLEKVRAKHYSDMSPDIFKEKLGLTKKEKLKPSGVFAESTPLQIGEGPVKPKDIPIKAPQMPLEAFKGQPGSIEAPAPNQEILDAARSSKSYKKEKVVIPLAQEAVEMFIPQEAYPYLPEAVVPEPGQKEGVRLEVGPSAEKMVYAGKGLMNEFIKSAADLGYEMAATGAMMAGMPEGSIPRPVDESKAKKVVEQFNKELKKSEVEQAGKPAYVRVAEFPLAVAKGAKDTVLGLADIVNYFGGISVRQGETREEDAQKKGAEVLAGMTGLTAGTVMNLLNPTLWETKPVEALMAIMPIYEMMLPKIKSLSVAKKFVDSASVAMNGVSDTAKKATPAKRFLTKAKQIMSEGFKTSEPSSSSVVEQMFKGPEAEMGLVKAATAKMAEEAKKGIDVEPVQRKPSVPSDNVPIVDDTVLLAESPEFGLTPIKKKYLETVEVATGDVYTGKLDRTNHPEVASKVDALEREIEASVETRQGLEDKIAIDTGYRWKGKAKFDLETSEVYNRMLAENVDAPMSALEGYLRKYFTNEGKNIISQMMPDELASFTRKYADYIKSLAEEANLEARKQAILTDTVVTPAKTKTFFTIDPNTGKLVKGSGAIADIGARFENKLGKETPDVQETYMAGEGESLLNPEGREFERQKIEQQKTKSVETATSPYDVTPEVTGQPYTTKNPVYEASVREIVDAVRSVYPEGQEAIITPERVMARFANALDNAISNGLPLLRSPKIRRPVVEWVKKTLEANGFKGEQLKRAVRDFDKDVINDSVANNNTAKLRDFEIRDGAGNVIIDGKMIADQIAKQSPDILNQAKADAIIDLGNDIALENQYFGVREALRKEGMRFMTDETGKVNPDFIRNPEVYVAPLLNRVIRLEQAAPVFVPFEGKKLAAIIRQNKKIYVEQLARLEETKVGRALTEVEKNALADKVEAQAARFDDMVKVDTSLVDTLAPKEVVEQYKAVVPKNEVFENIYAPADVASTLKWELESRQALQNPNFGLGIFQTAKRGLTARALSAMKNNALSNYFALSIKTGNPLVAYNVIKDGWFDFVIADRKGLSPEKQRAYNSIERSGLIDTTELQRDIGQSKNWKPIDDLFKSIAGEEGFRKLEADSKLYGAFNKASEVYGGLMSKLEGLYSKAGDVPFKVYEALRAYDKLESNSLKVAEGKFVEASISNNTSIKVTRSGEILTVEVIDANGNPVPGIKKVSGTIDSPKVSQLLGRAAAFEANKLFFDYGDVGTGVKMLRSFPVLNAISGFYTWYWKSLDIPGLKKKGMLSNTLFSGEFVKTNDPVIARENLKKATAQSMRRMLLVNSALGNVLQGEGKTELEKQSIEAAKKAIAFSPKDSGAMLIGPLADPANLYYNDFSNLVPFKATETLFKIGAGALASAAGFISSKDVERQLFPLYKSFGEMRRGGKEVEQDRKAMGLYLKDLRGELYSAKDVLSLVGLGGSAIFKALEEISASEEQGKIFEPSKIMNTFGSAFMGRTPWTLMVNAFGGAGQMIDPPEDPQKPSLLEKSGEVLRSITPYAKEQKKYGFLSGNVPADTQQYFMYLISQVIGAGWKKVNLLDEKENVVRDTEAKSRFEQYLAGSKKELEANLVKPLENKAAEYRAMAYNEKNKVLKDKYNENFDFYKKNVEIMKDQIDSILEKELMTIEKFFRSTK